MMNCRHYLTQLIVTVFLLPTLSPEAGATSPSSTEPPSLAPLKTVSCDALPEHTTGVKQRLNQYKNLVSRRKCIVLNADPAKDLSEQIKRIPENTVILLSSDVPAVTTPSLPDTPKTGKTPVNYYIHSEILLKDGQDILGAADDGLEIVIMLKSGFTDNHMIRVGTAERFRFSETRDSHVAHVTFQPTQHSTHNPIDSVVLAQCYNRRLNLENNVFHLALYGAAVDVECREPLDAADNDMRPGPGLRFVNNTLIGKHFKNIIQSFIPEDGLFINLPAIRNQSKRIAVIGNTFRGNMAEAGELVLGPGTQMDIFRNSINISNDGNTRRESITARKGGFALIGHTDTDSESPRFNMAGNQIQVTGIAITIFAQVELALACNHLQATHPWRQVLAPFSLRAVDPLALVDECQKLMSPTVTPTHTPLRICQIENTWTAINDSTDTALSGLVNIEGHLLFGSKICRVADTFSDSSTRKTYITGPSPVNSRRSTSSAEATVVPTALGVVSILAILFNL